MSEAQPGHNGQIRSITERINRLEDEKKTISDDIKDVYAEAKGNGLNPKALRVIVRKQRADAKKAAELQADVDAYMTALGMADVIAKWNPEFVGQTKRTFHRAASLDIEQALEMARDISVMMARLPAGEPTT